jgi:hypothetical protein
VSLILTLTETVLGVAVTQTGDVVQVALTVFVLAVPLAVGAAFFLILWSRPWVFYSPAEYGSTDVGRYVFARLIAATAPVRHGQRHAPAFATRSLAA